jgi:hypothetical protein
VEGPFLDPDIPDGERTGYRILIGENELGRATIAIAHEQAGERELYRQTVSARIAGELDYAGEVVFRRRSGKIHAESYELTTTAGDGTVVAREQGSFRSVRTVQFGGELEPYPRDLSPLIGCAVALRGLELEQGAERSFSAWLAHTVHWPVTARVEKREAISVPAGEREAWRVRLRPSLEQVDRTLDKLIDTLTPPLVAHVEAAAPHRLLRFAFPSGPFKWNPPGVLEATEL